MCTRPLWRVMWRVCVCALLRAWHTHTRIEHACRSMFRHTFTCITCVRIIPLVCKLRQVCTCACVCVCMCVGTAEVQTHIVHPPVSSIAVALCLSPPLSLSDSLFQPPGRTSASINLRTSARLGRVHLGLWALALANAVMHEAITAGAGGICSVSHIATTKNPNRHRHPHRFSTHDARCPTTPPNPSSMQQQFVLCDDDDDRIFVAHTEHLHYVCSHYMTREERASVAAGSLCTGVSA